MQMGVVYKQPLIDSFYSALFEVTGLVIALIIIAVCGNRMRCPHKDTLFHETV